jgi:hypothetical protein
MYPIQSVYNSLIVLQSFNYDLNRNICPKSKWTKCVENISRLISIAWDCQTQS